MYLKAHHKAPSWPPHNARPPEPKLATRMWGSVSAPTALQPRRSVSSTAESGWPARGPSRIAERRCLHSSCLRGTSSCSRWWRIIRTVSGSDASLCLLKWSKSSRESQKSTTSSRLLRRPSLTKRRSSSLTSSWRPWMLSFSCQTTCLRRRFLTLVASRWRTIKSSSLLSCIWSRYSRCSHLSRLADWDCCQLLKNPSWEWQNSAMRRANDWWKGRSRLWIYLTNQKKEINLLVDQT